MSMFIDALCVEYSDNDLIKITGNGGSIIIIMFTAREVHAHIYIYIYGV